MRGKDSRAPVSSALGAGMDKSWIACLIIVVPLLAAFSEYEGDGKLFNHGRFDANRSYTLTLGDIDLSFNGSYSFSSANLPTVAYVFGLDIISKEIIKEPLPINSTLELSISTTEGKKSFIKRGNLGNGHGPLPVEAIKHLCMVEVANLHIYKLNKVKNMKSKYWFQKQIPQQRSSPHSLSGV
jgi:hypothetical protein